MKFNTIQLIYFSPTHTSREVARAIAKGIQLPIGKEIDLTPASNATSIEAENTLTIIAVPTYAGRVAQTALDRLKIIKAINRQPLSPFCMVIEITKMP